MKDNEYQCEACGEVYEKGWTDEEAQKEADELWNKVALQAGQSVICDDCFQTGMDKHYRHRN